MSSTLLPITRSTSGPGYYAVFLADADGLNLEYAWTPARP